MNTNPTQRDVIYAELDDEVTTLFDRVRRARQSDVVIVIPTGAQILASLVNLKILRFKSEGNGKSVTIVTKDATGRRLAREAGLASAERVEVKGKAVTFEAFQPAVREKIEEVMTGEKKKKSFARRILDIATGEKQPEVIDREEIPFAEPGKEVRGFWSRFFGGVSEVVSEDDNHRYVVRPPSRVVLGTLLLAAASLLFFIVYIAVPTATVYVTPRADPMEKVVNATFTAKATGAESAETHLVPSTFFDVTVKKELRIGATGEIFEGSSAKGKVTLFNKTRQDKFLVASRLMSARDKIVYKTLRPVTIPAAVGTEPGKVDVEVVACERDDTRCDCINKAQTCEGSFVGDRGNIAPAYFVLPAIPDLSPSRYYAESSAAFTGGVTKITKFVSADDVKNVRDTVTRELPRLSRAELARLVAEKNQLEGTTLALPADAKAVTAEIVSLAIPPNLEKSVQDDFIATVQVRVRGFAYDEGALRQLLLRELEMKVHPEKRLTKIAFDGAVMRFEEIALAQKTAKAAVTITGVEEFNFDELTAAGSRLTEKMRSRVAGKPVTEAEQYIRNLPEISNVSISSWPFWARTVPELPENVKFKVGR